MSRRSSLPRVATLVASLLVAGSWLFGCTDDGGGHDANNAGTGSTLEAVDAPGVMVLDARVDEPASEDLAAVRLELQNTTDHDDRLVAISSPDADSAAVHRSDIDPDGRATMTPVTDLVLPAHSRLDVAAEGYHVMVEGLHRTVQPGDTITLFLEFDQAGQLRVDATVTEAGTALTHDDDHDHREDPN